MFGFLSVSVTEEVQAQSTIDFLIKRFTRKSKIKKLGKSLYGNGDRPPLEDYRVDKDFEVIGYEPSWLIDNGEFNAHKFNLLTGLVVGEYDINPYSGLPRNGESFKNYEKSVVKYSKGVKKDIIAYSRLEIPRMKILWNLTYQNDFGAENMRLNWYRNLLTNREVHDVMIDSLQNQFTQVGDKYGIPQNELGIVVDFKEISVQQLENLTDMLRHLRESIGEEYLIYLKIAPVVGQESFLTPEIITALKEDVGIDLFIVEASRFDKYFGPAPTAYFFGEDNEESIDSTVSYYLNNGITQQEMLVEFSYYGVAWEKNGDNPYVKRAHDTYVPNGEIMSYIPQSSPVPLSYDKDTTYAKLNVEEDGKITTYFYDNAYTLDTKYRYIADTMQLKGISIYGLGYNSRKPTEGDDYWYAIVSGMGKKKSAWGWLVASYLVAFIPLGFFFSVARYWQVRNVLAKERYKKYWNRFLIAFVIMTLISVIVMDIIFFLPRDGVGLIIGAIIVGFFVAYMLIRRYMNKVRKYTKYVK